MTHVKWGQLRDSQIPVHPFEHVDMEGVELESQGQVVEVEGHLQG